MVILNNENVAPEAKQKAYTPGTHSMSDLNQA